MNQMIIITTSFSSNIPLFKVIHIKLSVLELILNWITCIKRLEQSLFSGSGCPCPEIEDTVLFSHNRSSQLINLENSNFQYRNNCMMSIVQGPRDCSPCTNFFKIFVVWTLRCSGCSTEMGCSACWLFRLF